MNVSDADLFYTQNLVFTPSQSTNNIILDATIDLGIGYAEFNKGENMDKAVFHISAETAGTMFNHAGYVINEGAEVHLKLTNPDTHMTEWRKIGAGDLYIDGTGNTNALLNVGGNGKTYLQQTNGHAAYNVLVNSGATVIIGGINQIERDLTFGAGGGTLDMNGHNMDWYTSGGESRNGFTIQALTEEAMITNSSGQATLTYKQGENTTYKGSFSDSATGALSIIYDGGGTWTLNSIHTNLTQNKNSGFTVNSGKVILSGTNTVHGMGSATATNTNRLQLDNDWHYADAEMNVEIHQGGVFELGSHARLTGNVAVNAGGTFTICEGVKHQYEYVEGGSALENTYKYAAFYGFQGDEIDLKDASSKLEIKYSEGTTSNTSIAAAIKGAGAISVDAGLTGGTLTLSGNNTVSGDKTIISGGLIATTADALGNTETNKWKIQEKGWIVSQADTAEVLLSKVHSESTGVLALSGNTETQLNLENHQNLYIGAEAGKTIEYGTLDTELKANNGAWRLGGGGGTLNVNFLLTGENNLIIGNEYTSGTVHLTNTGNTFSGDIIIMGTGNILTYESKAALGNAHVALSYGNTLALHSAGDLYLIKADAEGEAGAEGILAAVSSFDLDISNYSIALGAVGDMTYTGTLTVDADKGYRFGGSGNLTLDTALEGSDLMRIDGQGNSGSSVTLARSNAYSGDILAGGGTNLETPNSTGSIGIHAGDANTFASTNSMVLQQGAVLYTDGHANMVVQNLTAQTGSSITNNGSTGSSLELHVTRNSSIADGVLNGANLSLVKTGEGNLSMAGNKSWSGGLTIQEGQVTVNAGNGGVGSSANIIQIEDRGTLRVEAGKVAYDSIGQTIVNQTITGTGTIVAASGGNMLLTQQTGFEGTVLVTEGTRLYVGKDLTYSKASANAYNNVQAFDNAKIKVDSGSQVRITNNFVHVSQVAVVSHADYIIAGSGMAAPTSNALVHESLIQGALSIDCGATLTGNVTLAEDATIASWSKNPTNGLYRPTMQNIYGRYYSIDNGTAELSGHYGIKEYLGGTIRGQILGEGKDLTIGGNESMTFTADSANTYGNLLISNANGNNSDKFALRLDGGKAISQTSTALGTGKVTLNDGLILRLAGTGTANQTDVVYTYANDIDAGNSSTLQSHNITNKLTGTITIGDMLNLSTANGGVLELAGNIAGNGKLHIGTDSSVILSGSQGFGGSLTAGAGASLTLASSTVLSATSELTGSSTLNLNLKGTADFTLGHITVNSSESTATSTLNLRFDFTDTPGADDADSWSTLTSSITANSTVIGLELNMFDDLRSGDYLLISQAGNTTDYSLADTMDGRLSLTTDETGALILHVGTDERLYWTGKQSSNWNADTNWISEKNDDSAYKAGAYVMLDFSEVDSTNERESIVLGSGETTVSTLAAQKSCYEISGEGKLTGEQLLVGNKGDLKLSNTGGASFSNGVIVNDARLEISGGNLTAEVKSENGASFSYSGGTLTGNLSVTDASAAISNATLAGHISATGNGSISLSSAVIKQNQELRFDTGNLKVTSGSATVGGTFTFAPGQTQLQVQGMSIAGGGLSSTAALDIDTLAISGGSLTLAHAAGTTTEIDTITGNGSLSLNSAGNLKLHNANLWGMTLKGSGITTISGSVKLTNEPLSIGKHTLNLVNGADVTVKRLTAGNTANGQPSTVNIEQGAILTISGSRDADATDNDLLLAHWGSSSSTLKLNGGTLNALNTQMLMGWDSGGRFEVVSGTANLKGIRFSAQRGNADSFLLGTTTTGDARVNLGSGGISGIGSNDTVNLGNGTIGALADFAINGHKAVNLIGTSTGTVFDTAGYTITVNTDLAGTGNLIKTGAGTLLLAGSGSDFSGNITVEGGSLAINGTGKGVLESAASVLINNGTLDISRMNLNDPDVCIQITAGQTFSFSENASIDFGNISANTEYHIFDFNEGTAEGWSDLTAEQLIIGGVKLSDMGRVQYNLSMNGYFSYNILGDREIVWNGGNTPTNWTQTDTIQTWTDASSGNTAFVNFDSVAFNTDANLTLDEDIHVNNLTVSEGVSLKTTGQLTIHGETTLGNGFSWDFSGNTTLSFSETELKSASKIVVGEGATLVMTDKTTGQNNTSTAFDNVSGTGSVELNLAMDNGIGFNLSGVTGDITVATGRLQVNTSTFNEASTIRLASSNSQLVFNANCELKNDVALDANTTIHANSSYAGTISGDFLGEDRKLTKAGGGSLTLSGKTTLKTLETYGGKVIIDSTSAYIEMVDGAMSNTAGGSLELAKNAILNVSGDVWSRSGTGINLNSGAVLALLKHNVAVINTGEDTASVKATTSNGQKYALNQANYEIKHARVVYTGSEDATLSNKLTNVTLENSISNAAAPVMEDDAESSFYAGSTLTVTNAGNTLNGVIALGGDISLHNLQNATSLNLLEIAAGRTVSAYVGSQLDEKSTITVTETAQLGSASVLNASLTLANGATLEMDAFQTEPVILTGTLTFAGQVELGKNLLAAVNALSGCDELVLFTGLSDVIMPSVTAGELESPQVLASSLFSNVQNENLYVNYQVIGNVGSLMVVHIPEPATTTLSLLALAALAARRRRK